MDFSKQLQTQLRIAEFSKGITALGPYYPKKPRVALWVQGCNLRCPECISPEWRDFKGGILTTVGQVITNLFPQLGSKGLSPYSGITISGGEPLEQIEGICNMLQVLHYLQPDFHVITYTGKTMPEIEQLPLFPRLAEEINMLMTGPYIAAENDGLHGLVGSVNQIPYANVFGKWVARNTLKPEQFMHPLDNYPYETVNRSIQFTDDCMDRDGMLMVGIPPAGALETFKNIKL